MNSCLLIHGLTGTPETVAPIRDALLADGYEVNAPCLAGHGGTLADLSRATWHDWYDSVRAAYASLRKNAGQVFCAGISLGALLCLKLACDEDEGIGAMALMGTPLKLPVMQRIAIPSVRYTPLRWIVRSVSKDFERSVADPGGRERYRLASLPRIPANAVFQIHDLQRELMADIGRVRIPTIVLHGSGDVVAPIFNVDILRHSLSSDELEVVMFERSRHVLTLDSERAEVARAMIDFFKRHSLKTSSADMGGGPNTKKNRG